MIFLARIGMLETNKQAFLFNFGEDLSYFAILQYKLRDLIKMCDDFEMTPYFRSAGKVWWNINAFGCIQHVKAYQVYLL